MELQVPHENESNNKKEHTQKNAVSIIRHSFEINTTSN